MARAAQGAGRTGAAVFHGFLATVSLAPLPLGANRPLAISALALVFGVLLLLWALATLRDSALAPLPWRRHGLITAAFLGLLAWSLVQTTSLTPESWHDPLWADAGLALGVPLAGAVSIDPAASGGGAMRMLCSGAAFWLALHYGQDPSRARRALWVLAAAGALYAVYGLVETLAGGERILWLEKWAYHGSLTATFVNRNSFAGYAGLTLLMLLALIVETGRRPFALGLTSRAGLLHFAEAVRPAYFLLIASALLVGTALVLTQSRAGLAAALLGVVILIAALAAARQFGLGAALGLGTAVLTAGLGVIAVSGGTVLARFFELDQTDASRGPIHDLAWRALAETGLAGRGPETFLAQFYRLRDAGFGWTVPAHDKAHSAYLELAIEAGPVAFAATLAATLGVIAALCRGIRVRRRRAIYPCLALGASALVLGHAGVDFSLQIPAVAILFATLLGLGLAQSWPSAADRA